MSEAEAPCSEAVLQDSATASPKAKAKRTRKSSATPDEPTQLTKTVSDADLIKLANKGMTQREIAAVTNLPKSTVQYKLQHLKDDIEFKNFKANKADVLEEIQFKLASVVDHDLLKSMVSKRGMTDLAILEDKIRLIRGETQSIQTIDIRALGIMVNATPVDVIDVESSSPDSTG